MAFPDVVTREQWLEARKRLLVLEKQATRERDALNTERRRLPMVRVEKKYLLVGDETSTEVPGFSCFLRDGDQIFHTYSTWARGTDFLGSAYSLLDLTALGRQEDWEEPKGRAPRLHGADPTFTD
jgi:predicted dithiol-disulfide oxidoreductase (DUF899 family)